MFGSYEFGKSLEFNTITIETYKENGQYIYHRKPANIKKTISSLSNLLINPIEPVTQPKQITHYLLIELTPSVLLSPNTTLTFFTTFPVEIGICTEPPKTLELGFFTEPQKITLIDSFTLTSPKYTLYGTPNNGLICKWWKSSTHTKILDVNPLYEGILHLTIQNTSSEWTELTKLVFDAHHMKLYYTTIAYMNASVKVNTKTAETSFKEKPLTETMKKAATLFTPTKLPVLEKPFIMRWGL